MPLSNNQKGDALDFQQKLLERLHRGDMEALGCLYDMHVDHLMEFGLHYVTEVSWVEDQIHDLFLDLFRARHRALQIQNLKAYLSTSLKRRLFKRSKSKELLIEEDSFKRLLHNDSNHIETSSESKWIDAEQLEYLKQALKTAMDSLTNHQQNALHLRFVEKKSYGEIAERMEVSKASARTLLYRSLKILREKVQLLLL
ncbi:sigma-70 family RNA polymerase sigma factor [Flagellimonas lutimaris]|uniref:Sigma-70 family RNA polymerase sigma factor n=1 Tax=Flagellimonas lutimaris TaxID=475082 RepID=A0A3A1N9C0_9FLAO|nr:sigma-70 family RNA polymerase sigma factor [Allomuricauda lutimaris]RIV35707.1 sigma-70 family RNA polymerase sigma factor [Allomuricauda lutimaris]